MRLIDADALYKFHVSSYSGEDLSEFSNGWNYCIKHLAKHAPTIEAVPVVHAEWVLERPGHYMCANCGTLKYGRAAILMQYCPDCGAKMDGGANDV